MRSRKLAAVICAAFVSLSYPLRSKSYFSIPVSSLLGNKDPKTLILFCELVVDGKPVSINEYFFTPYKNLKMPTPRINTDVTRTRDGFSIVLTSDKFARAVYLSLPGSDGAFSDNYFDLLPGRNMKVEYHPRNLMTAAEFRAQLKIRSMVDAFAR